jgi:hypothetical protein
MKKIRIVSRIAFIVSMILFWGLLILGPKDSLLLLSFLLILGPIGFPLFLIGAVWTK